MYKTTVYTLVIGRITHQKQQISEKGDITQQYIDTNGIMALYKFCIIIIIIIMLHNITFF